MALFQVVVNVKPTLATTRGTINYAEQAGEVDDEEIPGNDISSGYCLHVHKCIPSG